MELAEERAENLRLIRDSAAAIVPAQGDTRRIRALRFNEPGFDRTVWRQMAELGWIGLRVPEAAGGSGLGIAEFCTLAEMLGAGLTPEPLTEAALAAALLPAEHAAPVLSGTRIVLPAWQEAPNSLDAACASRLIGGRVTGRKSFIPMGAGADAFLVTTADGLALVAADAPGVGLATTKTQDGGHYATLTMTEAPGQPIDASMAPLIEEAALATAYSLLGLMERAFAITLDYLKTRVQFGRKIGSFQALQHRAVDLRIQIALSRASLDAAVACAEQTDMPWAARRAAISQAKARASDAAMTVTRAAIQLHGGIGYTDEYEIGLYLRKAMVLAARYGNAALHRDRFRALAPEDDDV
ncbi:MAG: acyl-CoA dehydrogenase family protein [Rhodospirillales bacterium]|nr:acyl-CoA dehydrogenase family protein [Rhodospirillales bacterium]